MSFCANGGHSTFATRSRLRGWAYFRRRRNRLIDKIRIPSRSIARISPTSRLRSSSRETRYSARPKSAASKRKLSLGSRHPNGNEPILQPRCPKQRGMPKRIQESGNPNVGVKEEIHDALALVSPAGGEGNVSFNLAGSEASRAGMDFRQKGAENFFPLAYRGHQDRNLLFLQERKRLLQLQNPVVIFRPRQRRHGF